MMLQHNNHEEKQMAVKTVQIKIKNEIQVNSKLKSETYCTCFMSVYVSGVDNL